MNQFDILPFELRKLGLTEKESKIYLASLELVKATAYEIAKKVQTSRPTVYRVLKGLEKKKLVSQTKDANKNYFTASSPEKLLGMLRIKQREAQEQEREFLRIISILQTRYSSGEKNKTKIFKGKRSHKNLLEIFSATPTKEIKIIFIGNKPILLNKEYEKINNRLRNIKIKELYFGKIKNNNKKPDYIVQQSTGTNNSSKTAMTLIMTDNLIVLKENMGLYTKDENIKGIMTFVFDNLWN